MIVCIEPARGFFFRINTSAKWQTPVRLDPAHHPFLGHVSHLECGDPLEIDDYVIDQSLRRRGVIGRIDPRHIPEILAAVDQARTLSAADKSAIRAALAAA